jgi:small-conductance mechanosensitive channel
MPLSNLLSDLINDIRAPGILWQAGAIAVCAVLGWSLARLVRHAFLQARDGQARLVQVGAESFARVLGPLLMLGLLELAKTVLAHYQPHVNLLRLAVPLFASFAVIRIAFYLLRRVFARHGPVGAAILTFEKIFALLVWAGVALYITGLWSEVFQYLDDTVLPLGRHKVSLATILQAAVSVVVLLMLALWAGAAMEERLMRVEGLHSSLRAVLARMSRALLIVVAVLASLSLVGIDLTVLSVFGGALGVGLGLGLQKIASNYVSGFVILLERSLSIGDMISVDKYSGKVTQINSRYTVLEGLDGVESVLPNEMLVSGAVQNHSLSSKSLRLATQLTVAFDTDLDRLLPLLEQAAGTIDRVLPEPAPFAMLRRFGADGFELELGFWIDDPENGRGGVTSDVNRAIWSVIQAEGVTLPFSTRDLRILDLRSTSDATTLSHSDTN